MNYSEIVSCILNGANSLIGTQLHYLTGSNYFTPTSIDNGRIRGIRHEGEITVSSNMIETYAKALENGIPVHVDTAIGGAGSERSALEALVVHLPHAGAIPRGRFNGKNGKHVIWFDNEVNTLGEIRDVSQDWIFLKGVTGTNLFIPHASSLTKALLAKPFLILTGPSGTGKTRGARRLAKEICEIDAHSLVAVGADWTDNRHVLGYLNPLESVEVKNDQGVVEAKFPIYETTPILELILHALDPAHQNEPHVLILDEMNLSHVERYFADFLSAMELDDKTDALKLHTAGMARSREGKKIPGTIDFPSNLFVIGTVNIDETTYMFSPKVLDRANVIEIHAGERQMENFLKGIDADDTGEEAKDYGISFLDAARAIQSEEKNDHVPPLPSTVRDVASDHLMALFRIMARGRTEYGFRTGKEVKAYLRTAHFLAGPEPASREAWAKIGTTESPENGDWIKALDAQILQKILPKLHGSRTRLAPLLGALATYCATGEETYAMEHFPDDGAMAKRVLKDATGASSQKFPESYKKLERMIDVLVEEQFVSFIC